MIDVVKKPYWYDYDNFETLDEAIEAASRSARRREERQVVYQAAVIVDLEETSLPKVSVTHLK